MLAASVPWSTPTLFPSAQLRVEAWVQSVVAHTGWLHAPAHAFALYGVVLFGLLEITVAFVALTRDPVGLAAALWAPLGTLLAVGLNQPLVAWAHEARPYTVHAATIVLVSRSHDPAFPSDHAVMAGAVAAGVWTAARQWGNRGRRWWAGAAGLALLMAVARVYVGAHWPLDVVVGLALGAIVQVAGWRLARGLVVVAVDRTGRLLDDRAPSAWTALRPPGSDSAPPRQKSGARA